jgi:hypothetical protein
LSQNVALLHFLTSRIGVSSAVGALVEGRIALKAEPAAEIEALMASPSEGPLTRESRAAAAPQISPSLHAGHILVSRILRRILPTVREEALSEVPKALIGRILAEIGAESVATSPSALDKRRGVWGSEMCALARSLLVSYRQRTDDSDSINWSPICVQILKESLDEIQVALSQGSLESALSKPSVFGALGILGSYQERLREGSEVVAYVDGTLVEGVVVSLGSNHATVHLIDGDALAFSTLSNICPVSTLEASLAVRWLFLNVCYVLVSSRHIADIHF